MSFDEEFAAWWIYLGRVEQGKERSVGSDQPGSDERSIIVSEASPKAVSKPEDDVVPSEGEVNTWQEGVADTGGADISPAQSTLRGTFTGSPSSPNNSRDRKKLKLEVKK